MVLWKRLCGCDQESYPGGLPYLYTLFEEASTTGVPVIRALLLEYPNDKSVFNLSDQFMIGSDVIVAPILTPNTNHRVVYLPEGNWVNHSTEKILEGNQHILAYAPIDTIPIFIKEGSIRVAAPERMSTKEEIEELIIHVYPKKIIKLYSHFTMTTAPHLIMNLAWSIRKRYHVMRRNLK